MRALFVAACLGPLTALADDFSGSWEVVKVVEDRGAYEWSAEIKYPKRFTIERQGASWVGHYVDQYEYACPFSLVAVVNDGRDLLLTDCGVTKYAQAYAPIHHVKKVGDTLHAVVITNQRLFEWVARRRQQ
jgi:hypothetical protein